MTKPMIRVHDLETNEVIDRVMNDEEYEKWLASAEIEKNREAAKKIKDAEKAAILEKLNITAEEAALLIG